VRLLALAAGAIAFAILATANAGGYRYGTSDQAFYVPAVARASDPALFPRDSAVLAPQMRLWLGDTVLATMQRMTGLSQPQLFAAVYVAGLLVLFAAAAAFARGLGASWWAVAVATALLTLRHRIPRTGANSLEGYMHPRMFAFGLGLAALALLLRQKLVLPALLVTFAWVAHPTTALWFAAVVGLAQLFGHDRSVVTLTPFRRGLIAVLLAGGAFAAVQLFAGDRMSGA